MYRNRHLYVNGIELYLDNEEIIPITKQANNIAELKDRQADFTTDFKIPHTRANVKALEHANILSSGTIVPYIKNSCTYVEDGIELISDGYLVLMSSSDKYFSAAAYSGNADFFKLIDKLKINNANISDLDHNWELSIFGAALTNKPDVKYLIFDPSKNGDLYKSTMDMKQLRPFVSCKRMFKQIFTDQGWTLTGDYDVIDEWLLCPSIKPSTTIYNSKSRLAEVQNVANKYIVSNYKVIELSDSMNQFTAYPMVDLSGLLPVITPNTLGFNFQRNGVYKVTISGKMLFTGADSFDINFRKSIYGAANIIASNTNSGITQDFSIEYELTVDSPIVYSLIFQLGNPSANSSLTIYDATFSIALNDSEVMYNDIINVASILPDMEQTKFLKSVANQYGLIYQTDSQRREVKVWRFDSLLQNLHLAKDWSKYISQGTESLSYRIGDYAQANVMKYKDGEGVPKGYGDGALYVNNGTLETSKELFELEFSASIDIVKGGDTLALIPLYEADNDGVFSKTDLTESRVVKFSTINKPIRIEYDNGGVNLTTYSLAYFINTTANDGLGFNYRLSEKFYNALSAILNDCKKIEIKMQLPITEIQGLDHSIPVYLELFASYFYVNKVNQWQKDKLCTVELIKIA